MLTLSMDSYVNNNKMDDVCSVTSFEEVGAGGGDSCGGESDSGKGGQHHTTKTVKDLIGKGPGKQALGDDEMPDVLYTVEYCNVSGVVFETRESDQPLDPTVLNNEQDKQPSTPTAPARKKPVIEIKSRWVVSSSPAAAGKRRNYGELPYYIDDDDYTPEISYSSYNSYARSGRPTGATTTTSSFKVEKTEMLIHSRPLISALAAVVGYYPDMPDFSFPQQQPVVIEAPYCVLVHHWRELESYRHSQPACHSAEHTRTTARDVDVLLGFLRHEFGDKLMLGGGGGGGSTSTTATFDTFWMWLKPGSVVYKQSSSSGEMVPYVVGSVALQGQLCPVVPGNSGCVGSYEVEYWNVGYCKGLLQRQMKSTCVYPWAGERDMTTLPLVPERFVGGGGAKAKEMRERQVRMGRMYWELAKGPAYREYEGEFRELKGGGGYYPSAAARGGNMTGRVVVDCEGWEKYCDGPGSYGNNGPCGYGMGMPMVPPGAGPPRQHYPSTSKGDYLPQTLPRCPCPECEKAASGVTASSSPGPFAGFDKRDPKHDTVPENEELYFLIINDTISAFILGERRWATIQVSNLRDVKPDKDAFKYLVLDPEVKMTVKALIGKFAAADNNSDKVTPWPNDFVKNKGEGRIFLLHGSPGVGKTCTAECVAELARRPLLSLTSGDISTSMSAASVERSLSYFLSLGERFGALVLLDEADVYLERRRARDLRRNGLVSVFLRALEYYRGVLFLTTNRVEAFDSAFTSRIHVALHYRRLTDEDRRRVWMNNFDRLERDSRGGCHVTAGAREYAFEAADMRALRWNGREIRNALQTAVALAEAEADEMGVEGMVVVGEGHLRAVVRMSSGFREFLSRRKRRGSYKKRVRSGRRWEEEEEDSGEEEDDNGSVTSNDEEEGAGEDGEDGEEEEDEDEDEDEDDNVSVSSAETEDHHPHPHHPHHHHPHHHHPHHHHPHHHHPHHHPPHGKWNGSPAAQGHQGIAYHHPIPPPPPPPAPLPVPQIYFAPQQPHQVGQHRHSLLPFQELY